MSLAYMIGTEDKIIPQLGGSAVATHAEKHGITKAEAYQIRSKKAEVTTLKKEYPPIKQLKIGYEELADEVQEVKLSNGRTKEVSLSIQSYARPGYTGHADVSIFVDDDYIKGNDMSAKDGLKVALKARTMVSQAVKKLPDGVILRNDPSTGDGLGDKRTSLYKKAGFSAEPGNSMLGITKGGKIKPITVDQLDLLRKAGYVKP